MREFGISARGRRVRERLHFSTQTMYASVQERQDAWVVGAAEKQRVGRVAACAFMGCFVAIVSTGVAVLSQPHAHDAALDVALESTCYRATRRADYAVVHVTVGVPQIELKLLFRPDVVTEVQIKTFSERLHMSTTLSCAEANVHVELTCSDVTLRYRGTLDEFSAGVANFSLQSVNQPASMYARALGLDGTFGIVPGHSHWLTSTHLCVAPSTVLDPPRTPSPSFPPGMPPRTPSPSSPPLLLAHGIAIDWTGDEGQPAPGAVNAADLAAYVPTASLEVATMATDACMNNVSVALFPIEAVAESHFLKLDTSILYDRQHTSLERRRKVVELGEACAEEIDALERDVEMYRIDCAPDNCASDTSLPFRRLADHHLRIDVDATGKGGVLQAAPSKTLATIPSLLSYDDGVHEAIARLVLLVLVAAIVFIRGNQNASSALYITTQTLDRIFCRRAFGPRQHANPSTHSPTQTPIADFVITASALLARTAVLWSRRSALDADGFGLVAVGEIVGIVASFAHALSRNLLRHTKTTDTPLTLLGGPMAIVDATSAVLLTFSESPMLSKHPGANFAAVGRLLVSVLVSVRVFGRCILGATCCAMMASCCTATPSRIELWPFRVALVGGGVCWVAQAVVSSLQVAALFVIPASYAIARSRLGTLFDLKLLIFLGMVATGLPSMNKVVLKVAIHACEQPRDKGV